MDKQEFESILSQNVSRETWVKLETYAGLLEKWQKKINLVSGNTINDLWSRHIVDSAQIFSLIKNDDNVVDFGSGAGFPALVLSAMGIENICLIESDRRKCSFLREVIRSCSLSATVVNDRVENVEIENVSCITARALSSLSNLLSYSESFLNKETECVFLKGQSVENEIVEAEKEWKFTIQKTKSLTSDEAFILKISKIKRL